MKRLVLSVICCAGLSGAALADGAWTEGFVKAACGTEASCVARAKACAGDTACAEAAALCTHSFGPGGASATKACLLHTAPFGPGGTQYIMRTAEAPPVILTRTGALRGAVNGAAATISSGAEGRWTCWRTAEGPESCIRPLSSAEDFAPWAAE